MQPTLSDLKTMAKQAGALLRAGYETPKEINRKGFLDLVTEYDHRSENFLIDYIQSHFAGHSIFAEESGHTQGNQNTWHIDPLDGTVNFAHGVPCFCVSIAFETEGQVQLGVVYDPLRDECFSAARGQGAWLNDRAIHVSSASRLEDSLLATGFGVLVQRNPINDPVPDNVENFRAMLMVTQGVRRLGSAALDLCYTAAGRFDGYWEYNLHAWDIAAGALIVEEAGGKVTTIDGQLEYFVPPYSILAASPQLYPSLHDHIQ